MSDRPLVPQVSPDGKFYWDGTQWLPRPVQPERPDIQWDGHAWRSANGHWVWHGSAWAESRPKRGWSPRRTVAIAVGGVLLTVALLGTCTFAYVQATNPLTDTWTFDGARWHQVDGQVNPGLVHGNGAMAWDAAGHRLILFGFTRETWAFDSGKWVRLRPRHTPSANVGVDMASTPDGVFLVGGNDINGTISSASTWLWQNGDWTDLRANLPNGDYGHLVYDSNTNVLMMFSSDLWEWKGGIWTSEGAWSGVPISAYDPSRKLFLGAGCYGQGPKCGTWSWSGGSYAPVQTDEFPYGGYVSWNGWNLIYDPALNEFLLIAESSDDDKMRVYEELAQSKWQIRKVSGAPASRKSAMIGFDPTTGLIVMYGGCGQWCSAFSGPH